METVVSRRGQTVVPAAIRTKYNIKDGDQLVWIDDGQTIRVIPVPADPTAALYGRGKGQGLTRKLMYDRAKYRKKKKMAGKSFVLDTSALMALIEREEGYLLVQGDNLA